MMHGYVLRCRLSGAVSKTVHVINYIITAVSVIEIIHIYFGVAMTESDLTIHPKQIAES